MPAVPAEPSTSQAPSLFSLGRHAEFRALLVEKGRKTGEFRTPKFEFRTRIGLRLAFTRGSRPEGNGGAGGRTRAFVYKSDTQPRRGLHTAVQASDRVPQVVGHDQVAHSAPTAWLERGPQRVRRWHGASPATGVVARYAMPLPVGLLCVSWRAWRSSTDHRLRLQSDGEQHQVTIMSLRVGPPAGRRTVLEEERDAAVRAYAGPRHPLQARRRAQTVGAGCRARRSERLRA